MLFDIRLNRDNGFFITYFVGEVPQYIYLHLYTCVSSHAVIIDLTKKVNFRDEAKLYAKEMRNDNLTCQENSGNVELSSPAKTE